MIALLFAMLLPRTAAVQAAEQEEKVILTEEDGKAEVEITIPDEAAGVSALRLRIRIEGAIESLDPMDPFIFESDENLQPVFSAVRYRSEEAFFTVYFSGIEKITDKSVFRLGSFVPNITDSTPGSVLISVPENGLEYADAEGRLHEDVTIPASSAVLNINQPAGGAGEIPGDAGQDAEDGATGGSEAGEPEGGSDGATGGPESDAPGSSDGETADTPAAGSETESPSGADPETSGNNAGNTGEVLHAVQTGDSAGSALLIGILALSGSAAAGMLLMRRAWKK